MAAPTLVDVVRLSTRFLSERGSDSPRLDAELLAAHSLGLRRIDLYLQHDRPLGEDELDPMRSLLRRRAAGEPVAYLVGEREFYGRPFRVTPDVLIPRPETETLVERTLRWARATAGAAGEGLRLADAGTGSGCIACTLAAELPGAEVVAGDVSAAAVAVARDNAARLGLDGRVRVEEGSWEVPLAAHAPFDALLSNPPYVTSGEMEGLMREVRDHEPRLALLAGEDGLAAYRELLGGCLPLVRAGGFVALEIDPRRRDAVVDLVAAGRPGSEVRVLDDLAGRARVVEARLR
ncbi:MAG TPA: peptide chain release factor N(5)-glutamine methyltransferase [Candidatus Dormibacteraeota bacterium]